ncbi:hypothetical protein B0H10DRAFT_943406 [Mycena sp. CBHHK59/15]|nr:hypothetical protein B0H10DRAFT_943406 [Mycena sp. CBHHK59/15]
MLRIRSEHAIGFLKGRFHSLKHLRVNIPGRMDGVQWNGDSFVCATEVDDGLAPSRADIIDGAMEVEERADSEQWKSDGERMVVCLLDIARLAKRRGTAKRFEVLPTISRIIALEDERAMSEQWEEWEGQSEQWESQSEQWEIPEGDYGEEEWEQLYGEQAEREQRKLYSAALRGKER